MKERNPFHAKIAELTMKIHNLRQFIQYDENLYDLQAINRDLVQRKRELRLLLGMDNKLIKEVIKSL